MLRSVSRDGGSAPQPSPNVLACAALLAVAAAVTALDCGRSHDLGIGGAASSASTAGAGGLGGFGGTCATTASTGGAAGSSTSGTGGTGPTGPTRLTVVNGINDYPGAIFCFLPNDTPWPSSGGLRFGAGEAADIASVVPTNGDVQVWVVAGDLASVAGATCTQLLALAQGGTGGGGAGGAGGAGGNGAGGGTGDGGIGDSGAGDAGDSGAGDAGDGGTSDGGTNDAGDGGVPPRPVVAAELGVIPQSVFESDQSLLLVSTGCMGGPGHDASAAATACGTGYTSTTPTTSVVLLGMSRITSPSHVALQAVNASAVLPESDVGVVPNLNAAMEVVVAPSLEPGAIGPSPPFTGLSITAFGPLDGVQLDTYPPGSASPQSSTTLGSVLASGNVGASGFVDGAGLVLVAVGSAPGQSAGPFWHALTFVLVKADPG